MKKIVTPILLAVLLALIVLVSVPAVVKNINEAQTKNRFFEMGRYYKSHTKKRSLFLVNEMRDKRDPRERAVPMIALAVPDDEDRKLELDFLLKKVLFTRDVHKRNEYVDSFISGFDSK